ncbi:hypothetical protein [Photobacterium leiognathi]|uniref:hypothetical protein n=1 Tax=Photobacterium leiognathi TaxID=553611 RepID=UPI002738D045|nr:hypothetical protein [Photobacterium leiognathi]
MDLNNNVIATKTYPDNGPTFEVNTTDTGGVLIHRVVMGIIQLHLMVLLVHWKAAVASLFHEIMVIHLDAGVGTATQDYNTAQDDNGARHIRFDSDVDGQQILRLVLIGILIMAIAEYTCNHR